MMITTTVRDVDLGTDWNLTSLGLSLTDTLDDLINEGRIEPQLAMKILSTFDKVVTEVLAEKVRARLTFKVHSFRRRSHVVISDTRSSRWLEITFILDSAGR